MINLKPFQERFSDDQSCKKHFRELRESKKVICRKCSCTDHFWLKSKEQWQCKKCHFRTTLKSGTIFQYSNLNFYTWYKTIYIVTQSDKILNTSAVKRILGLKRYETVWYMMHKIRTLMLASHHELMNDSETEVGIGVLKFNNRKVHFGELRRFLESCEVDKQHRTYGIKLRYGRYERVKIFPYYDLLPLEKRSRIIYSFSHLRGTLDQRKTFFKKDFHIQCCQLESKVDNMSKGCSRPSFKMYAKEIYTNWRTVSNKFLQLYLDEVSFNLNFNSKKMKLGLLINQGVMFNWHNSG